MMPSYCAAMVGASTPDQVLEVARSVLADLTAYAAEPPDSRQWGRHRAAANWAAGEMALAARLMDPAASQRPVAGPTPADDFLHLKLIVTAALAREVDDGRAGRLGDWATARMWATGSPVLAAYLAVLGQTAAAPRALPSGARFAAAVVEAASVAFGKLPVSPEVSPGNSSVISPPVVRTESRQTMRANTTTLSR